MKAAAVITTTATAVVWATVAAVHD
eukprot:COSAG06_NODE_48268_length_333_cov_0.880342_1_plen_24_part_10